MKKLLLVVSALFSQPVEAKTFSELKALPPKVAIKSPLDMDAAMACVVSDGFYPFGTQTVRNTNGSIDWLMVYQGVRMVIFTFVPINGGTVVEARSRLGSTATRLKPCLAGISAVAPSRHRAV